MPKKKTPSVKRAITQETFDEVVRENIDELELDLAEALDDAVEQFEAQVCGWGA